VPQPRVNILDTFVKAPFSLSNEQRRLHDAYVRRWKFYLGQQETYLGEDGELQLIVNYARALANKINDFMFGKGFVFRGNVDLWPFAEPVISQVWRGTRKKLFGNELGQMGGVTGDVYVKVWWDDDPSSVNYNTVQFTVLPSTNVVPMWEPGRTGKDRKMSECRVIQVEKQISSEGNEEPSKVYYTTIYNREEIIYYKDNVELSRDVNQLGEIPIVHIQNQPLAGDYYGVSDIEDLMNLQEEINTKISAVGNIIDYHGAPVTLLFGIRSGQLSTEAGKLWHLPKRTDGVDVVNLDRTTNLREASDYIEKLREYAHEMSSVPEASLGKMQPISNTSGVALHMQFLPIMHLINRKMSTYGPGLVELTRLGIKLMSLFDPSVLRDAEGDARFPVEIDSCIEDADERIKAMYPRGTMLYVGIDGQDWNRLDVDVEWPDVMPKDILMEIETARNLQSMGLLDDRKILEMIVRSGAVDIPAEEISECVAAARLDAAVKMQAQSGWMGDYGGMGVDEGLTGQDQGQGSGSAMQSPNERVGHVNSENGPKGE